MGLRFRKSVTLCKGVKLNFGKTGMSVSVGGKGYHKTINTKGQVLVYQEAVFITLTQKDLEEIDKLTHKETFKINTIIRIQSENHSLFRNMKSMIVLNPI